jgi:hypothetical protein
MTVKIYRPCDREKIIREDLTKWARGGKIEITLKREFFRRANIRIEQLGEQPEIFELIRERITREVKGMINTLSKQARAAVARELGLETYTADSITQRMLNIENTMTYVLRKIKQHDREIQEIKKQLAKDRQKKQTEEQDPWNEGVPF